MTQQEFNKLFTEHYEPLVHFAHRILKDHHRAEDLVQDSFAALWKAWPRQTDASQCRSFLYTCTRNNCINWLKRVECRRVIYTDQPDEGQELVEAVVEANVLKLLATLPERCRDIVVLRYMGGHPCGRIAKALGIAKRTVINQVTRGKSLLLNRDQR